VALIAGLAGALALWIAPQASATITTTSITSPTDPTYSIYDGDAPNTIAVTGTTDSDAAGSDLVDLQCFYGSGPSNAALATNVPLAGDGSFSVSAADLANVDDRVCRLRAVPAGTIPANLTPFAGPLLATGERSTHTLSGGPNDGTPYDYYIWGQQLTAAFDYVSIGDCGLYDGYLFDASLAQTAYTFYCNDGLDQQDTYGPSSPTRSELQVDGANAYTSATAQNINDQATPGFPALAHSYSLDPATGNLTIHESDPIVRCPDATYPPDSTSCPSFDATGVRVDRTITQQSDGHLVFFSDRYVSTDGQQHSLDLLPQNDQYFGGPGSDVQYKFPGESSYSTHALGDVVSFPASVPAAVYVNVQGAADGDTSTGQGAIVFNRPASPATFNDVSSDSELHFHQTGVVTATCSPSFGFAYAQDYEAANVTTLAQTAMDRFSASPATACSPSGPAPTPTGTAPTGKRAAALKKCKKKHKRALHKKRKHHKLNKKAKRKLGKRFKKCKRGAQRLPV
jgi:hypothetical protein